MVRSTLVFALLCSLANTSLAQLTPEVGKPLPGFVLPRIDTRAPVHLADYRGKKWLLIQFASW